MPVCTGLNMPEWTVIAVAMRDRTASTDQRVPGNHRMKALVPANTLFGRTRSRKSIPSNPFHPFSEAIADAQDLEDLLHQLVRVVHRTTALLDMSAGTRRKREVMEGDELVPKRTACNISRGLGQVQLVSLPSLGHGQTKRKCPASVEPLLS